MSLTSIDAPFAKTAFIPVNLGSQIYCCSFRTSFISSQERFFQV